MIQAPGIDKSLLKYSIIAFVILLPTLAFPISSDLSVFMHGGSIIANGGGLFSDFYDIKPPLIYYLFAGINSIFGDNVFAFRIFDLLYQMSFLILTAYLLTKLKIQTKVIKAFLILFPLSYTILNYRDIFQTESLAFIPLILYFYYMIKNEDSYKQHIIMGLTLGIALAFKYTLGIIFVGYLIYFFKESKIRNYTKPIVQLAIAFFIVFLSFLPVIISGNISGFMETNIYLAEYAKYPPIGIELVKTIINFLSYNFGTMTSVSYLFLFAVAIILLKNKKLVLIKKYLLIFILLLFCSVILERKINLYHVIRIYPYMMILVSFGLIILIERFRFGRNISTFVIVSMFLILSPLLRFVNTYKIAFDRVFNYESYLSYYTNDKPFNILGKHIAIADYINKKGDDKFLFMNTGGNQAVHYLDFDYRYKFPHSAFHLSPKAPLSYKKAFEEDLHDANIIAIDSSDDIFMIFLSEGSSYDLFFGEEKYKEYIDKYFTLDTILMDRYFIYERKIK